MTLAPGSDDEGQLAEPSPDAPAASGLGWEQVPTSGSRSWSTVSGTQQNAFVRGEQTSHAEASRTSESTGIGQHGSHSRQPPMMPTVAGRAWQPAFHR